MRLVAAAIVVAVCAPFAARAQSLGALDAFRFVENNGQWDGRAAFLLDRGAYRVWFAEDQVMYDLDGDAGMRHAVRLRFAGSRRTHPVGLDAGDVRFAYAAASGQANGVRAFGEVRYRELYRGIDLRYYERDGALKYDLILAPHADPDVIRLVHDGADGLAIASDGGLRIRTSVGELREEPPYCYQEIRGRRRVVPCRFVLRAEGIAFAPGDYDRAYPLVIDPALIYSSYLGGARSDEGRGVALDAASNIYVTGISRSNDFPLNPGPGSFNNTANIFVAKLDPTGSTLRFMTYLDGNGTDAPSAIRVRSDGSAVIVAGSTTSSDFPVTNGSTSRDATPGAGDGFVLGLNAQSGAVLFSTYVSGSAVEEVADLTLASGDVIYLTGWTRSPNFLGAGPIAGGEDAFVLKMNRDGTAPVCRLLSGSGDERATGIEMQGGGAVWVSGWTTSSDFRAPLLPATFGTPGIGRDCFVARLWFNGTGGEFAAIIGGSGDDEALALAVVTPPTGIGDTVYFTGRTASPDYPASTAGTPPSWFVTKLIWLPTPALIYSRYLGGANSGGGTSIHVVDGSAFLTGTAFSSFPTVGGIPNETTPGGAEVAFVQLDAAGTVKHASVVGGIADDVPWPETVLSSIGDLYVTGTTSSRNLPLRRGALDTLLNNGPRPLPDSTDAFLMRFGFRGHPAIFAPTTFTLDTLRCDTVMVDTFFVSNMGDEPLVITRNTPSRPDDFPFTVVEPVITGRPDTIPPRGSRRYVIRYQRDGLGNDSVFLSIFTNDPLYGGVPFKVLLKGVRSAPTLLSVRERISFGTIFLCEGPGTQSLNFRNGGISSLTIVGMSFSSDPSVFTASASLPRSLRVGEQFTATVRFQTAVPGPYSDTLLVHVREKDCDTVVRVPVEGVAAMPDVVFAPGELSFPALARCVSSVVDSVELVNRGPGTVHLELPERWAAEEREFALESLLPDSLRSGESVVLRIRFSPKVGTGTIRDTLLVQLAECDLLLRLPLEGARSAEAIVEPLPSQLDFGTLISCPGVPADSTLELVLRNPGTDPVILRFELPGSDFVLTDAPGSPFSLEGGGSVTIHVRYTSSSPGTHTGQLEIPYQSGPCVDTLRIPLRGAHDERRLTPAFTGIQLDTIRACRQAVDTVLKVYNRSAGQVRIASVETTPDAEHLGPVLGRDVVPGDSVELRLRVTAQREGDFVAQVRYLLEPCGDTMTITLRGRKEGVSFTVGRDRLEFPARVACSGTAGLDSVVLVNTGSTEAITIQHASIPGGAPFRLAASGIEGRALQAGERLAIPIAFDSAAPGSYAGELELVLGPCDDTVRLPLAGTILPVDIRFAGTDFGPVPINQARRGFLTVRNTGPVPVRVESIGNVIAPFTVVASPLPADIPPGDSVRIEVEFRPDAPVAYAPTVLFQLSAPCVLTIPLELRGSGIATDAFCVKGEVRGRVGDIVEVPLRTITEPHSLPSTNLVYYIRYDRERLEFVGTDRSDIVVEENNKAAGTLRLSEPAATEIRAEQFRLRFRLLVGRQPIAAVHLDSVFIGVARATLGTCNDSTIVRIDDRCVFTNVTFGKYSNMLGDVQPNPVGTWAELTYQQMEDARTVLRVFDAAGREVLRPLDAEMPGGRYTIQFSVEDLDAGAYFYTIEAGTYRESKRMLVK